MGGVADGGEQGPVGHGGARAEQDRGQRPGKKALWAVVPDGAEAAPNGGLVGGPPPAGRSAELAAPPYRG